QAVWIEESLKDAPGGVAEKPNHDHKQQRTAEWLSEDGRERAARPRDASACLGCDLEGQYADDHVEHTLYKEANAGEPLDGAETFHRSIVRRILPHDSGERSRRVDTWKLAETRVSPTRLGSNKCLFRREQTPACTAVSLHIGVRGIPDREGAESPSLVTSVRWTR